MVRVGSHLDRETVRCLEDTWINVAILLYIDALLSALNPCQSELLFGSSVSGLSKGVHPVAYVPPTLTNAGHSCEEREKSIIIMPKYSLHRQCDSITEPSLAFQKCGVSNHRQRLLRKGALHTTCVCIFTSRNPARLGGSRGA